MSGLFRFTTSATKPEECPFDAKPEIAFLGRSNSGKSSLINAWAGSGIAKVSGSPGKTRLVNFFEGAKYRLVDFPGYGYSSRSGDEQASWAGMIEPILSGRSNLRAALLLVDCRRILESKTGLASEELMLIKFLGKRHLPVVLVLTKADKLNRAEESRLKKACDNLEGVEQMALVSSAKRTGLVELEDFVYQTWIKP